MRLVPPLMLALVLLSAASFAREAGRHSTLGSEQLGGDDRPLTHVTTDKPIYRAGETLFARGLMLRSQSRRPVAGTTWAEVEIRGPKGEMLVQQSASCEDGVAPFTWSIPDGQPGGRYTLRMVGSGAAPGERSFEVRAFRAPRIKSQIVFLRDGHGPGDEVTATLTATRAEGGAPEGAGVTLVAVVDGAEVARRSAGTLDEQGRIRVSFMLPEEIERGEGTLALIIEDGGTVETATKTIPILVRTVDLEIFPEGGDLVAGIPARVYLEARTPAGEPADIAGDILSRDGKAVASFRTEHEGRGRVLLTPRGGEQYRVRITEPAGIAATFPLPEVAATGGNISAFDDVAKALKPLRLRVAASHGGKYDVTVSSREVELVSRRVELSRGELRPLSIPLDDGVSGVLRVTLWDDGRPLAERLVFRSPAESVLVALSLDRERHVPAAKVQLTVKTTRADGSPLPSTVGISVSDDSVRELLETRDQPPQLSVMVFLESDVRELADAAVYLDPDDPQAPRAVDLLLGTQGWRRFALVGEAEAFVAAHGDAAHRVLASAPGHLLVAKLDGNASKGLVGGIVAGVLDAFAGIGEDDRVAMAPMPAAAPAPAREDREEALQAREMQEPPMQGVAGGLAFQVGAADRDDAFRDGARGRAKDEVAKKAIMRERRAALPPVRVYAHAARPGRMPGDRADFTDTVYWNAGVRTDENGEATMSFDLSDSITSFRVLCDAFTSDGILGSGSRLIESVEPFYIEPKMPLELTTGDLVRLPVTSVNGGLEPLSRVVLGVTARSPLSAGSIAPFSLEAGERGRSLLEIRAGAPGLAELTISGTAATTDTDHGGMLGDAVTRSVRVAPLGFPVSKSYAGMLLPGGRVAHPLTLPDDLVEGSVRTDIRLFPSSLGKLTSALERLIQEPHGCFEQTSSTTYPLVMAAQYFATHQDVDPALITRSQEMLAKGYQRLTSFETETKGFEWFGESPGHEALTAFGLLEFTDMSRVREVDSALIARTRGWLLDARDGKGGFKRERRALHTWIEDQDCSNAYITWALVEAGEDPKSLVREIDALARTAQASGNAYVQALAASVLGKAGRHAEERALLDALAKRQAANGAVEGATASIVGSTGDALQIETTALAALAWMRSKEHGAQADRSIRWLAESCEGGRFGSTQSTVLALRAIVAHDVARAAPRAGGRVRLLVDGKAVGEVAFDESTDGSIVLPDASAFLTKGAHHVELEMEGGSEMPYAIEVQIHREKPESSPDCPLELSVTSSAMSIGEGEIAEIAVTLANRMSEAQPMVVAVIGLPGGLEVRHEQLKELVSGKRIAAYEVQGREVVLYFRTLAARASERIPLSVVAAVPGTYTGPASRAYLYYGDENKVWVAGLKAEIAPL